MTAQLALTVSIGVGVLTLATMALLNTAGLKLHDVTEDKDKKVSRFTYDSGLAHELRRSFAAMPEALGAGVVFFVIFMAAMYSESVEGGHSETFFKIGVPLSVAVYIGLLLYVTVRLSRRIYGVLRP